MGVKWPEDEGMIVGRVRIYASTMDATRAFHNLERTRGQSQAAPQNGLHALDSPHPLLCPGVPQTLNLGYGTESSTDFRRDRFERSIQSIHQGIERAFYQNPDTRPGLPSAEAEASESLYAAVLQYWSSTAGSAEKVTRQVPKASFDIAQVMSRYGILRTHGLKTRWRSSVFDRVNPPLMYEREKKDGACQAYSHGRVHRSFQMADHAHIMKSDWAEKDIIAVHRELQSKEHEMSDDRRVLIGENDAYDRLGHGTIIFYNYRGPSEKHVVGKEGRCIGWREQAVPVASPALLGEYLVILGDNLCPAM
jgi:hypothetical protein